MADFKDFLSTDGYLARLTRLNEIKTALAQLLSVGSHSNVPEGAIRYSKAQKRWEVYTGGTWGVLEAEYNINVKKLQDAEPKAEVSNNSIVKRTEQGQIKAANPAANDDVTTRGASDARYLRQDDLGKDGGVTVQFAAHADQADQAGHAQTAGDASSVGGIAPGQIALLTNIQFGTDWQVFNVTDSRGNGTTYHNNTPYAMFIGGSHQAQDSTAVFRIYVDGVLIAHGLDFNAAGPRRVTGSSVVPAGSTYRFEWGSGGFASLSEIRRV